MPAFGERREEGEAENTVKNHLKNILEKLHLENRVQAATFALRQELGTPPNPDRR